MPVHITTTTAKGSLGCGPEKLRERIFQT